MDILGVCSETIVATNRMIVNRKSFQTLAPTEWVDSEVVPYVFLCSFYDTKVYFVVHHYLTMIYTYLSWYTLSLYVLNMCRSLVWLLITIHAVLEENEPLYSGICPHNLR